RKTTPAIISRINELLDLNKNHREQGRRKQQLKMIDIHEDLISLGHEICYTSVCNLIKELSEKHQAAYIRQEYELGEECEFDWGEVKLKIAGVDTVYQFAIFTTCAGNYRYGRLFEKQDTASFQSAHAYFFQKIGGVFKKMTYDNMRVVVKKFVGRTKKEPTDGLLKLSAYYLFDFRFCNVRSGNEKGHVERSVEYLRRKIFGKRIEFSSLEEANEYLENECDKLNLKTPYGATKSATEFLEDEQKILIEAKPFFEVAEIEQLKVDKYSTISYQTCRYSVPEKYVNKCVTVRIYPSILKISYNDEKICEHKRLHGKTEWSLKIEHYIKTLKRKPGALSGSLALKQITTQHLQIYDKYYKTEAKGFIELLDYMKKNELEIKEIQEVINQLEPIKEGDIITDKIERICEKNKEEKSKKEIIVELKISEIETNEIKKSSLNQLKDATKLFETQTESKEKTMLKEEVAA
ncbi:MAG: IS21 family transposase, partial [Bacteroidales bacterium]|nr:IS21 family transposase [Bacteroidales bacterium]